MQQGHGSFGKVMPTAGVQPHVPPIRMVQNQNAGMVMPMSGNQNQTGNLLSMDQWGRYPNNQPNLRPPNTTMMQTNTMQQPVSIYLSFFGNLYEIYFFFS